MKIDNKKLALISVGTVVVLTLAGGAYYGVKRFEGNSQKPQENSNNNLDNPSNNNGSNNNSPGTQSKIETALEVTKPKEGDSVVASRVISGRSQKTGGKVSYKLSGQEAGLLAEGVINTNGDESSFRDFSVEFSYLKKPIEGDIGTLKFFDAGNKELKSVGVTFN